MNRTRLKVMLVRHEGLRLYPYTDTVGKLTIGVGRNIEDRGITAEEAAFLLDNDITFVFQQLSKRAVGVFTSLDEVRQHVLLDMAFMGIEKVLGFRKMWKAIERRDFEAAAREMLDSKWATQVGVRATELAAMMKDGVYA